MLGNFGFLRGTCVRARPALLPAGLCVALLSSAGCLSSDDEELPEATCAEVDKRRNDALAELEAQAPRCDSDSDCVIVDGTFECPSVHLGSCGIVLHREAAAQYERETLEDEICSEMRPSEFACSVSPACAAFRAACEAGSCVSQSL